MKEIIEEPILLTVDNDFLGTLEKADAITNFIKNNKCLLDANNMIALYGEWGSGKSSILKTVKKKLNDEGIYKTIWIDMWKEESDCSNLNIKILNKILLELKIKRKRKKLLKVFSVLKKRKKKKLLKAFLALEKRKRKIILKLFSDLEKRKRKKLLKAFLALAKGIKIDAGIASYDMKPIFEQLNNELEESETSKDFALKFEKKIKHYYEKKKKQIVVFLDDIDRCNNDNMLNIIYNIKLLLSVKNIVFIFGIDRQAVTLALKNKYNNEDNKADNFLEKIFPISFNVPHELMNRQKIEVITKKAFQNIEEKSHRNIVDFFEEMKIVNPRMIIKIINKYRILENELKLKGFLDDKNEWNIILILFLIMEHEFNIENYVNMLSDNKKHMLSNVIKLDLSQIGRTIGRRNIQYEEFPIEFKRVIEQNGIIQNVYESSELYEYFSIPKDLIRENIPVIDVTSSPEYSVNIKFETWMDSFSDSYNKRFCYFVHKNKDKMITGLSKEKKYDEFFEKLKKLVHQIDLVL